MFASYKVEVDKCWRVGQNLPNSYLTAWYNTMQDSLSLTFSALADPTRRAMLAHLSRGEASVSDLARPFLHEMTLPAVTKHIKVLEKAGLVTKTKDAQWRPCKLNGAGLKEATNWMDQYRIFWEASFDRLEAYLKTGNPEAQEGSDSKSIEKDQTKYKKEE